MISVKDFESTRIRLNDSIAVELGEIDSRRESTRRGVWVLIDDYCPYLANSPLYGVCVEGCNSNSESDSEFDSEPNSSGEVTVKTRDYSTVSRISMVMYLFLVCSRRWLDWSLANSQRGGRVAWLGDRLSHRMPLGLV